MSAEYHLSATLLGCADNLRESFGAPVYLQDVDDYARLRTELVNRLSEPEFNSAYVSGRSIHPVEMMHILAREEPVQ